MMTAQMPPSRASRIRRPFNPWPFIALLMAAIGAVGGTLLARR
jgi:hypothetical protein